MGFTGPAGHRGRSGQALQGLGLIVEARPVIADFGKQPGGQLSPSFALSNRNAAGLTFSTLILSEL
jgi:hypothetical protein